MNPNKHPQPLQATHGATPAPFDGRVSVIPAKPGNLQRLPIVEVRTGKKKVEHLRRHESQNLSSGGAVVCKSRCMAGGRYRQVD